MGQTERAKRTDKETAIETFGEMLRKFGTTVGEIFDDPAVKEKGKEFAASVVDAAANIVQNKIKDAEARSKFRSVGEAAETLGSSVKKHFEG